ncbi:MAG: AI-2E family transporter [Candidatus Paceibacterota bacterium]
MNLMTSGSNNHYYVSITPSTILWAFLIALLFLTAYILHNLILVILTSVLLAAAISPVAKWFVKHRIPRVVAVLLVYAGVMVGFLLTFYFLFVPLLQETFSFIRSLPEYMDVFEEWLPLAEDGTGLENVPFFADFAGELSPSSIIEQFQDTFSGISQGFVGSIFALFGGVLNFVLILVLSFYLSVQEEGVAKFLKMVTPAKNSEYVLDLWRRAEIKIGYWMQGQLILAVIVAVLVYLCLTLLGVPHALLLAVLAGVFELIPVFGPILSALPAMALGFAEGGNFLEPGLMMGVVVGGVFLIIQQFESQLIYPLVIRKVVGLSPIIVIIALIAGYELAGFMGVILSVPVAAIFMEFLKDMQPKDKKPKYEHSSGVGFDRSQG